MAAIYDGHICGDDEKEKCSREHGNFLDWECGKCREKGNRIDSEDISPLTQHLLWLRRLQKGGAPLAFDALDLETWERLGIVADIIEAIQRRQAAQMMLPRMMRM